MNARLWFRGMSIPWADIASLSAAVLSAIAAVGAWMAARRSNSTADAVASIERDRWHADLTPQFQITARRLGPGTGRASLHITLAGPAGLPHLGRVRISIRDDGYLHLPGQNVSQEEIDAQIWGPFQFEPGIDGASGDGRTVVSHPLDLGDWAKFALSPSGVPSWHPDGTRWREQYDGQPIRLTLECHTEGHRPWYVAREVPVMDPQPRDDDA